MALIWKLLLIFGFARCHILNVVKDDNSVETYDEVEGILKNIQELQLQDPSSSQKDSELSALEAGQHLKKAMLHIMYLETAWKQLLSQIDVWELSGALSSKLSSVSPAAVKDEDASDLLDYILSTVKPFLNNSMVIADVGTALNMHNCSVNGVIEGLQRDGPVKLIINDDLATLSFTIATNTLSMSCDWHQWMVMKYYGTVSGILTALTVETIVDLNLQPNQHPVIRSTEVKNLGEIKSDITGIGPLGMLVKTIINKMIQQYRKMLIDALEHEAPVQIQYSLDKITLPNAENITSAFNNNTNYQQHLNEIKNKTMGKITDDKKTENVTKYIDEYSENRDNKSHTKIQNQIVNPKFKHLEKEVEITDSDINEENNEIEKANSNTNEEESDQIIHPKFKYLIKEDEKANYDINEEENKLFMMIENEDRAFLENQNQITYEKNEDEES